MEEKIEIKLKLLDNSMHKLIMRASDTIKYLKEEVEQTLNIPIDKQRLIFSGRYLRDDQTLQDNQIENGHVIHLIARPNINSEDETQSQSHQSNQPDNQDEGSVLSDLEVLQDIIRQFNHIQLVQQNQRKRYLQQRTQGYIYLQKDQMQESIQQNQESIEILMNTMNNNESQIQKQQYVESFDFSKRQFKIGQWVDVKDTINQWLEAQIIKINEVEQKVFIHYNGWGTRWDEWIDIKSERIALFRTHTVQSQGSLSMSPYPISDIDGDKSEMPDRLNFDDILLNTCSLLNNVNSKLIELNRHNNNVRFTSDKQEAEYSTKMRNVMSSQLAPILDRAGRMLMDIGMMLGDIGSDTQRIYHEDEEDEEEKSQTDDQNDQQNMQGIDILSNRSNSSLGRYSNIQSDNNYYHNEREGSQTSNLNRFRLRNNYRFQQPVMLNPGELYKINKMNSDRVHIQRIIFPSNQSTNISSNFNNSNLFNQSG
ncbi:hypothetical protein ABPG72_012489 [Tetrahymena utriculariae]